MTEHVDIRLTEWGASRAVPLAQLSTGVGLETVRSLAEAGVIGLLETDGQAVVSPRGAVGTARSRGLFLELQPRRPALFRQMRRIAEASQEREVKVADDGLGDAPDRELSVAQLFLKTLGNVISCGLPIAYKTALQSTSNPAGEIDFTATVTKHASRGVLHRVVERYQYKATDGDLIKVLAAAGGIIRSDKLLDSPDARRLDIYLEAVGAVGWPISTSRAIRLARSVQARLSDWPDIAELMRLAILVLDRIDRTFTWEGSAAETTARFVYTDRLWESVVLELARLSAKRSGLRVQKHPLAASTVYLFDSSGPDIDPDVLMFERDPKTPKCVLEAKYSPTKTWRADDVYQLLAYCSRLECSIGVLVYLSQQSHTWWRLLGESSDGMRLFATGLSAHDLTSGLADASSRLHDEISRE